MKRYLTLGYGGLSYLIFLAAFLYSIGFVGNLVVPRGIDHGVEAPIGEAVVVNVLLLGLLAVQHSVMARPAFKRWSTRLVPKTVARSTYVSVVESGPVSIVLAVAEDASGHLERHMAVGSARRSISPIPPPGANTHPGASPARPPFRR
jgi:hypothetical protein